MGAKAATAALLLGLASPAAGAYAKLLSPAQTLASTTTSPFSGAGLATHSTGLADDSAQCPALLGHLNVAASPRVLPKRGDDSDPLGLWKKPPGGPRGPSVFKLNQGRAIDMLRQDYPNVFTQKPDLSIFTKTVELHDPSGKRLRGLNQYERVFDMFRFLRRTTMQDAQVTYRLVVVDDRIRVRWTAKLWMRDPALGLTKMANGEPIVIHIDGVSNYDLDDDGKIFRHTVENIILRGTDVAEAVPLAISWPNLGLMSPELAMPVPFFRPLVPDWSPPKAIAALFETSTVQPSGRPKQLPPPPHLAAQPKQRRSGSPRASADSAEGMRETPMQRAARERAEDAERARRIAEVRSPKERERKGMFGISVPQPCDTSYDCERPMVCCDLLFGSICCNGGLMIPTADPKAALQRQAIPIPVEADNGPRFPGPSGGNLPPSYPGGM